MPQIRDKSQISVSVFGKTRNNLIPYSNMDKDSNSDGVVDGFSKWVNSGITASHTFDATENAQKIQITASTNTNSANVFYTLTTIKVGDVISAKISFKMTGNVICFISIIFRQGGTQIAYIQSLDFTSTTYDDIKLENVIAPANTDSMIIYFQVKPTAAGNTGTAWFKNALLEKAAFVGNYIQTGVKSTLSPNSPLLNY